MKTNTMESNATTQRPSDEADSKQLAMARDEGAAYQRSLTYMVEEVADSGGRQRIGDYIVAYAQERAEGMFLLKSEGQLDWAGPGDANCHLEVSVSDAADRRFIPALDIDATLIPSKGTPIGPLKVPFVWHPGLYHYGVNVKLPGDGRYTLRIRIKPPTFMRHDEINGRRYAKTVEAEFKDVEIKTGRE